MNKQNKLLGVEKEGKSIQLLSEKKPKGFKLEIEFSEYCAEMVDKKEAYIEMLSFNILKIAVMHKKRKMLEDRKQKSVDVPQRLRNKWKLEVVINFNILITFGMENISTFSTLLL